MRSASLFTAGLLALSNVVATSSPTRVQQRNPQSKRWNGTPGFVYAEGEKFKVDGRDFYFAGTTAYWLTQVQANDITKTLDDIAAHKLGVVRIWGFREVVGATNDDPATYTQQWVNGEQKCNQHGIDRIKFILDEAQKRGIYVQISLTNNWSPDFPANGKHPGSLSNSYGGMDTYVQQIHPGGDHDLFYTDDAVKDAYKKWLNCIIPPLASHKAVFAWELANDPRCQGAKGRTTSGSCNTHTITRWTADTADFVKSLDPYHMVSSGDGGFYCTDCPKLFSLPPPPPTVSGGSQSNVGKRSKKRTGYLTTAMVRERIKAREKAAYRAARNAPGARKAIRGGWAAPVTSFKRQSSDLGSTFDGSFGVDSEDIVSAPSVDFGSFQFFPDQQVYALDSENGSSPFDNVVQQGLDWIQLQGETGNAVGKPTTLNGFGIVSQPNGNTFTPFNSATPAPIGTDVAPTEEQQVDAYKQWITQAIQTGITGVTQYQWGQTNLPTGPNSPGTSPDSQGASPNDGYAAYSEAIKNVLTEGAEAQQGRTGPGSDQAA
ncbi:hypothetical protein FRC00_001299 [Tulasnella sp. 408]|nr:hypothetical protein FRC00_001299 [Tulasnella sp. 408]